MADERENHNHNVEEEGLVRKRKHFDDLFETIGQFGCYQCSIYIFGTLIEASAALCMLYFIFESANPGWSCIPVHTDKNGTESLGNMTEKFCPGKNIRCENLTFSDEFSSISTEWGFICENSYVSRIIQSTFFVGLLVGACIGGFLADTFGRKKTVISIWVAMMLSQASTSLSSSWMVYMSLRIIAGISTGGIAATTMVIPTEYLGPKYRILSANRIGWSIGGLILALAGYLLRNWRWHAASMGLLMLPTLPVIAVLMPESARWLVKKRRFKEAAYWLNKIARSNGRSEVDVDVLCEIAEDESLDEQKTDSYSYLDLFRNKEYSLMTFTIIWIWFTVSFITYGISSNIGRLSGSIYLNVAVSNATSFVLRFTVIYVASKLGRKGGFYLYMSICLVCLVVVAGFIIAGKRETYATVVTGLVLLSVTGTGGVWGLVSIIPMEAYPTMIRSRSYAIGNISARIGGILAPYVGLLFTIHATIPYILYLIFGIFSCVFVRMFIPETLGRPLPEALPVKEYCTSCGFNQKSKCEDREEVEINLNKRI